MKRAEPGMAGKRRRLQTDLRRGMSLLEVVVATVILAGSLAILGQLINAGRISAAKSIDELGALTRCQSIMDAAVVEVSTGVAVPDMLLEDGDWTSEVIVDPTESETLVQVTVTTKRFNAEGRRAAVVELTRLVYLPPEDDSLSEGTL